MADEGPLESDLEELGDDEPETTPCPDCGAEIYEDSPQCPVCGYYVLAGAGSSYNPPWWWLLAAGAVIAAFVCYILI
jgi:hypothetical protein